MIVLTKQQLIDEWWAFPSPHSAQFCRVCQGQDGHGISVRLYPKNKDSEERGHDTPAGALCLHHWLYATQCCPQCHKSRCLWEESRCSACDLADGAQLDRHVYRRQQRALPESPDYATTRTIINALKAMEKKEAERGR